MKRKLNRSGETPTAYRIEAESVWVNLDAVRKLARENFSPEDLFTREELGRWAIDNNFMEVKE